MGMVMVQHEHADGAQHEHADGAAWACIAMVQHGLAVKTCLGLSKHVLHVAVRLLGGFVKTIPSQAQQ